MPSEPSILTEYLSPATLAKQLGVTERTLLTWANERRGPPMIRVGRKPFYSAAAVKQWLERGGTLQPKPARKRRSQVA